MLRIRYVSQINGLSALLNRINCYVLLFDRQLSGRCHQCKTLLLTNTEPRRQSVVVKFSTSVCMPSLSPTMSEGIIAKWHKAEGDSVRPGDLLCDIQTDKAVVSFEFEEEGILAKVLQPEGSSGRVGDVIAVMADPGEDWKAVAADSARAKPAPSPPPSSAAAAAPVAASSKAVSSAGAVKRIGPTAQLLLRAHHLTAADPRLRATGPHGTLLKSDVATLVSTLSAPDTLTSSSLPPASAQPASAPPVAAFPTVTSGAIRPAMTRLEPRSPPVDHPVGESLRAWATGQAAAKLTVPHAYATAACRPRLPPAAATPSTLGALAVRALAGALAGQSVSPVSVGFLVLSAPALPRVAPLPRAQALGLREIAARMAAAEKGGESVMGGPLDGIVCDLSAQGAVHAAHLPLHPAAPVLLTIGSPSAVPAASSASLKDPAEGSDATANEPESPPLVQLGLTVDSRLLDHAQAAHLLGSVAASMENPLLLLSGLAGGPAVAATAAASADGTTAPPMFVGSDILQLGLDD